MDPGVRDLPILTQQVTMGEYHDTRLSRGSIISSKLDSQLTVHQQYTSQRNHLKEESTASGAKTKHPRMCNG